MNKQLKEDLENLEVILNTVKAKSIEYLEELNDTKTSSIFKNTTQDKLPQIGIGAIEALNKFHKKYKELIVSSSGPRFWGYVTGGSTPASIVGDWLASIYDQNTQGINGFGDISANIELQTINMMLDLFHLQEGDFLGGFVTGATMSSFTCLAVARQWYGKEIEMDIAKNGMKNNFNVLSATPHSSAIKALSMLGMGSTNFIKVNTIKGNGEAICLDDLEEKLKVLNGEPAIIISSAGTVNTVDFDDFIGIEQLKRQYKFWWHIDAAFGGFAACSEEYQYLILNWDKSDSVTIDCHKWMNVPYESAIFFIKKKYSFLQTETFQNSNAPYLGNPFDNFNYLNLLPENSRRLKALPVWFTLQAYGKEGYAEIVDNCISLAKDLGHRINSHASFKLLAPIRLNNICFTLNNFDKDEEVQNFLMELNQTGKVFMTPTRYSGVQGIRCSLVNWRTTKKDIDLVFSEMERIIQKKPAANNT